MSDSDAVQAAVTGRLRRTLSNSKLLIAM